MCDISSTASDIVVNKQGPWSQGATCDKSHINYISHKQIAVAAVTNANAT